MITEKDINKEIVLFRYPTEQEWAGIGQINIRCKIGEPVVFTDYIGNCENPHVQTSMGGWYPACCFKLYEENYEMY